MMMLLLMMMTMMMMTYVRTYVHYAHDVDVELQVRMIRITTEIPLCCMGTNCGSDASIVHTQMHDPFIHSSVRLLVCLFIHSLGTKYLD